LRNGKELSTRPAERTGESLAKKIYMILKFCSIDSLPAKDYSLANYEGRDRPSEISSPVGESKLRPISWFAVSRTSKRTAE